MNMKMKKLIINIKTLLLIVATVCIYNIIYDNIYTYGMIPYDCATVRTVFLFRRNRPKNWPPEAGKDSILFDLISSCLLHRASL